MRLACCSPSHISPCTIVLPRRNSISSFSSAQKLFSRLLRILIHAGEVQEQILEHSLGLRKAIRTNTETAIRGFSQQKPQTSTMPTTAAGKRRFDDNDDNRACYPGKRRQTVWTAGRRAEEELERRKRERYERQMDAAFDSRAKDVVAQASPLLRLPAQLRKAIYELAIEAPPARTTTPPPDLGLPSVGAEFLKSAQREQLHEEAAKVWHRKLEHGLVQLKYLQMPPISQVSFQLRVETIPIFMDLVTEYLGPRPWKFDLAELSSFTGLSPDEGRPSSRYGSPVYGPGLLALADRFSGPKSDKVEFHLSDMPSFKERRGLINPEYLGAMPANAKYGRKPGTLFLGWSGGYCIHELKWWPNWINADWKVLWTTGRMRAADEEMLNCVRHRKHVSEAGLRFSEIYEVMRAFRNGGPDKTQVAMWTLGRITIS